MDQIRRGELKKVIRSARAINLVTGEEEILTCKGDSYCHFLRPNFIEGYKVQLRIDWSDLDENSHPTLDADFYDCETGKKMPNTNDFYESHHTKVKDKKTRIYEWKFKCETWTLKIIVEWILEFSEALGLKDQMTLDAYRNGKKM